MVVVLKFSMKVVRVTGSSMGLATSWLHAALKAHAIDIASAHGMHVCRAVHFLMHVCWLHDEHVFISSGVVTSLQRGHDTNGDMHTSLCFCLHLLEQTLPKGQGQHVIVAGARQRQSCCCIIR